MYTYLIATPLYTINYYSENKKKDLKEIEETYYKLVKKSIEFYKKIYNTNSDLKIENRNVSYRENFCLNLNALLTLRKLNGARIVRAFFSTSYTLYGVKVKLSDKYLEELINEIRYLINIINKTYKQYRKNISISHVDIIYVFKAENEIYKKLRLELLNNRAISKEITNLNISDRQAVEIAIKELFNKVLLTKL